MSTINEDVSAIKTIQDGLVKNKVARFSYTQKAYTDNIVDGVDTYNVNNEQNIPNGTAAIMKVNDTIINKGYRAQASSITRMLMNHFLGRISYNLNKVNDNMKSLIDSLNSHLGTANGIATLDADAKVPRSQLNLGTANGIATLDANAKVPESPLNLGTANGIATLDSDGKLSQTQLPDISPDLSRAKKIVLVDAQSKPVTWTTEFDCWILEVIAYESTKAPLSINGNTNYTPEHNFTVVTVEGQPTFVENSTVRCPYFVKKGIPITFTQHNITGSGIIVAPCMYVNA